MQINAITDPYCLLQDGSRPLTANWDVGGFNITNIGAFGAGAITGASLKILEGGSTPTLYGIFSVPDLSAADKTYTFPSVSGSVAYSVAGTYAGIDSYINQAVKTTSSPTFATAILSNLIVDSSVKSALIPDVSLAYDLGVNDKRWNAIWARIGAFSTSVSISTLYFQSGSIIDSTGAISFGDENLTTSGTLGAGAITGTNFISSVATGTQPYACTSTTLNTNLNADLLDGQHASAFQAAGSYLSNIVEDTTPQLGADLDGQSLYDLTNMVDGAFSGTVQAEQLTSIDDITMAGKLLNTLAVADTYGLVIDGNTNPLSYSASFSYINNISRTIGGSGATGFPSTGQGIGTQRQLIWDYDFSGTRQQFGAAKQIAAASDTLLISGNISLISGGVAITPSANLYGGYSIVNHSGAISSASAGNLTLTDRGVYYGANLTSTINRTNTGTITVNVMGGEFYSLGSPTLEGGSSAVNINYYGGKFIGLGTSIGDSVVYGGYFSGTGGDTNWDIYAGGGSNNALKGNTRMGGVAAPTVACDVTGAMLASTTIEATTNFRCNATAGVSGTIDLTKTATVVGGIITAIS